MVKLITTLGARTESELGFILPHEHIFVDFRPPDHPEHALADQIMLSQDRGWYDPAKPGGGEPLPYTYLNEHFLPKLQAVGVNEETVRKLTHTNPYRAFAR